MIRNFEPASRLESDSPNRMQGVAALGAGIIAGIILLVVPRGNPWSVLTFFAPVIMGRVIPAEAGVPFIVVILLHLATSVTYGLVIARTVASVTQLRALLIGALVGLGLYLVNFGIVSAWMPMLLGNELSVAFTHVVFGAIAGGAYRGLLQRRMTRSEATTHIPPATP